MIFSLVVSIAQPVQAQTDQNKGVEGVITITREVDEDFDGDTPEPPLPSPQSMPSTGLISYNKTESINTDAGGEKIPFQYIVVFDDAIVNNITSLQDAFQELNEIVENIGAEIIYTYNSYAGRLCIQSTKPTYC